MNISNILGEKPDRELNIWKSRADIKFKKDILDALAIYKRNYDKKNLTEAVDTILRNALLSNISMTDNQISNGEITIHKAN